MEAQHRDQDIEDEGSENDRGDQCQFGLTTKGKKGQVEPARKRTRLMSNSDEILRELGKLCPGDHRHQHLVSGRAEDAAVYPDGLCRAICRGLVKQVEAERNHLRSILRLCVLDKVVEVPDCEEKEASWQSAWDDVSGKELNPSWGQSSQGIGN